MSAEVTLEEGGTSSVVLALEPSPSEPSPRAVERPAQLAPTPKAGRSAAPFVAFGAGAIGLGVGIVGAVTVARASSRLEAACSPDKICPESAGADLRDAKAWATASTVGFIAFGAGVVTGTVMLFTGAGKGGRAGRSVQPTVGVGSVGLHGVF